MTDMPVPSRPAVHPLLRPLALVLAVGLALLLGACEPAKHVPTELTGVLPPAQEQVQYRRLTLDNGLQVMLVSDPNADMAGAAMSVGVGSLSDPQAYPGLAHFLEHMLFLGTEKYPEAGSFQSFVNSHAGFSNAYTADDQTNYFFEVSGEALPEALDRFSWMFRAPLFNPEYAAREMNAVASEHAKNLENDYWRVRQVMRDQFRQDHPLNHFSTGSAETLRGVGQDVLRTWYRQHYSANLMRLAVVSNRSLDELEEMVGERFREVPDRGLERPSFAQNYLAERKALRVVRVKPVTDQRQLIVHFQLPPVVQDWRAKPLQLIAFVLGHEGEGSLLSGLKADDLAHSLSAGGSTNTRDFAGLELTIGLTEKGLQRWHEVLARTLGAIDGLRREGIPRYLYEQNRRMAALDFRYRTQGGAAATARHLSATMQDYPLDELPGAAYLLEDYAPAQHKSLLERMRPDNMLVALVAQSVPTNRTEPHYNARYSYTEETGDAYARLASAPAPQGWHLPAPNPFIPDGVALIEPQSPLKLSAASYHLLRQDGLPDPMLTRLSSVRGEDYPSPQVMLTHMRALFGGERLVPWIPTLLKDTLALPVKLLDTPLARVWYLPDYRLRQPKAEIHLKFYVDDADRSPSQSMLAGLYVAALEEGLNEWGYPIREAGMDYSLNTTTGGLVLSVSGYSARLPQLLESLVQRLDTVTVDEATFASLKERIARGIRNSRQSQPYQQAGYYKDMLLVTPNFTREARLQALEPLTLADVRHFARSALQRTYVQGVVVGNLTADASRSAMARALRRLASRVLPPDQRVGDTVRELPAQANWVFSQRLPVSNSLVQLYYQVGEIGPELQGALQTVGRPLSNAFYHELRTQQQLGYIVWAGMSVTERTLGMTFLVQSGEYGPDVLRKRMDAFVQNYVDTFRTMDPEQFAQYKQAVIDSKLEQPQSLSEVAQRLFYLAFRFDERFDKLGEDIAALERMSHSQVTEVIQNALAGDGARRLTIRLIGKGHEAGPPQGKVVTLPDAVQPRNAQAGVRRTPGAAAIAVRVPAPLSLAK